MFGNRNDSVVITAKTDHKDIPWSDTVEELRIQGLDQRLELFPVLGFRLEVLLKDRPWKSYKTA
jgi:hypothetical protein